MAKAFVSRHVLISAKDFDQLGECNQDLVTPAPPHIPFGAVSVRVREHPHEERTPFRVVSCTEQRDAAGIVK